MTERHMRASILKTCKSKNYYAAMTNETCKAEATQMEYLSLQVKKSMVCNEKCNGLPQNIYIKTLIFH